MKFEKVEKLITNLHDKFEYVIHRRNLKQALNHGLVLKKVNRRIQFNQIAWLKSCIDLNIEIKKNKMHFEKDFLKLMNNGVLGKIMEHVRKQRDVKLVTTERKRNYLVSEPNYQTYQKFSTETLLVTEMGKTQILMNKPVYLGLSILDLSKTVMYRFWYDYLKPKYGENAKLIGLMINEK